MSNTIRDAMNKWQRYAAKEEKDTLEKIKNDRSLNQILDMDLKTAKEKENFEQVRNVFSEYVKSTSYWEKETIIRILNDFFADCLGDALENYYPGAEYFIKIDKNTYHEYELETKLLRYLQTGEDDITQISRTSEAEKTNNYPAKDDISHHFGIKRNTIQKKLDALQSGIDIMGSKVEIKELRRVKNSYDSTVHPVFLSLNLTEMYFLTIVLKRYFNNAVYGHIAKDIANDIFGQASDYAKDFILKKAAEENISFPSRNDHSKHGYRNEEFQNTKYLKSVGLAEVECSDWDTNPKECYVYRMNRDNITLIEKETGEEREYDLSKIISIKSI